MPVLGKSWPVSSMYRNKLRGINQWLCYGFPSTCLCWCISTSTCLGTQASCFNVEKQTERDRSVALLQFSFCTCLLGKSGQCLQCTETNWEGSVSGSAMVFLVHVCADLFRVLAHASAYLCLQYTETNWEGSVSGSAMVFLVHVCADLFRVLAHTSAWDVKLVSSMFRNKQRDQSVALLWFS